MTLILSNIHILYEFWTTFAIFVLPDLHYFLYFETLLIMKWIGYKRMRQLQVDSMKITSKKGRRNDYPIILVHGTLGFVDDQNAFLRSYWSNSFSVLGKSFCHLWENHIWNDLCESFQLAYFRSVLIKSRFLSHILNNFECRHWWRDLRGWRWWTFQRSRQSLWTLPTNSWNYEGTKISRDQ